MNELIYKQSEHVGMLTFHTRKLAELLEKIATSYPDLELSRWDQVEVEVAVKHALNDLEVIKNG